MFAKIVTNSHCFNISILNHIVEEIKIGMIKDKKTCKNREFSSFFHIDYSTFSFSKHFGIIEKKCRDPPAKMGLEKFFFEYD